MSGQVSLQSDGAIAVVTLSNPRKLNAMTRAMWRELKDVFTRIQASAEWRCVLVRGEAGNFCAGGDIAEYPAFRFEPESLRQFHEQDVWGGLSAMLACDVPITAAIEGHCMGAGVEIACCCDLRVAAEDARFGAPIARLGFPMAPREAQLVARVAGEATVREMLLEAAVLPAAEMKARGFLQRLATGADVLTQARATAERIAALAPQAARLNKRTLRSLSPSQAKAADVPMDTICQSAYDYADSAEHREGVTAFLDKRAARF